MHLNEENYITYLLLYIDNELNAEEQLIVEAYVASNSEAAKTLQQLQQTQLPNSETLNLDKTAWLKPAVNPTEIINETNYTEYFSAYIDNELEQHELETVDSFVHKNPLLQAEWETWQHTQLPQEKMEYAFKNELLKKESKPIVYFNWKTIAAAALLLLSIGGGYILYNNNSSDASTVVKTNKKNSEPNNNIANKTNNSSNNLNTKTISKSNNNVANNYEANNATNNSIGKSSFDVITKSIDNDTRKINNYTDNRSTNENMFAVANTINNDMLNESFTSTRIIENVEILNNAVTFSTATRITNTRGNIEGAIKESFASVANDAQQETIEDESFLFSSELKIKPKKTNKKSFFKKLANNVKALALDEPLEVHLGKTTITL
jgi:hypothetical protein